MGIFTDGLTPREIGDEVIMSLKQLAEDLEVPQYLGDVNIPERHRAARRRRDGPDASAGQLNPRALTREDVIEIYERCAVRPEQMGS